METNLATKTAGTKHAWNCSRVFARRDPKCPRCLELAAGAPARAGWGPSRDAIRCDQVKQHFTVRDENGETGHERNTRLYVVDTAFEW